VIKDYWENSKAGNLAEIASLTVSPPSRLYVCNFISRVECDNKLRAEQIKFEKHNGEKNFKQLVVDRDDSIIKENAPRAIRSGTWNSYSIKAQQVFGNEARLSVSINAPGPQLDTINYS